MPDIPTQPTSEVTAYRLSVKDEEIKSLNERIGELEDIVNKQSIDLAALKERVSIFSLAQATLTIIIGAVAAWIGRMP